MAPCFAMTGGSICAVCAEHFVLL